MLVILIFITFPSDEGNNVLSNGPNKISIPIRSVASEETQQTISELSDTQKETIFNVGASSEGEGQTEEYV